MRQFLSLAAVLVLVAGCGEPPALSLDDQALHELQAGRYDAAIATSNAAIAQNPKDAAAFHCRGRAYHYRNQPGDIDRAIADFDESIQLAPKDPETYYSRSIAYRDQGNAKASAEDEMTARNLDVKLKETYAELTDLTPPGAAPQGLAREEEESPEAANKEQSNKAPTREETNREDDAILERARARSQPATSRPKTEPLERVPDNKADSSSSDERIRELLTEPQYKPAATSKSQDGNNNSNVVPMPRARPKATTPMRASRRPAQRPSAGMARAPEMQTPPRDGADGLGQQYTGVGQRYAPNFQRPVQSPFPQAPARPTGRFEQADTVQSPFAPAPREGYNNPYSAGPAVQHLPGAYQTDFNP